MAPAWRDWRWAHLFMTSWLPFSTSPLITRSRSWPKKGLGICPSMPEEHVAGTHCNGDASETLDVSPVWQNRFDSQLQVLCETRFPSQDSWIKDKDNLVTNNIMQHFSAAHCYSFLIFGMHFFFISFATLLVSWPNLKSRTLSNQVFQSRKLWCLWWVFSLAFGPDVTLWLEDWEQGESFWSSLFFNHTSNPADCQLPCHVLLNTSHAAVWEKHFK